MFGCEACLPVDVMYGSFPARTQGHNTYATQLQQSLAEAYHRVRKHLQSAHLRQKHYYDQRVHGESLGSGDLHTTRVPAIHVPLTLWPLLWHGPWIGSQSFCLCITGLTCYQYTSIFGVSIYDNGLFQKRVFFDLHFESSITIIIRKPWSHRGESISPIPCCCLVSLFLLHFSNEKYNKSYFHAICCLLNIVSCFVFLGKQLVSVLLDFRSWDLTDQQRWYWWTKMSGECQCLYNCSSSLLCCSHCHHLYPHEHLDDHDDHVSLSVGQSFHHIYLLLDCLLKIGSCFVFLGKQLVSVLMHADLMSLEDSSTSSLHLNVTCD